MDKKETHQIPFSRLVDVNPDTSLRSLSQNDNASFIGMADIDENGNWINRQSKLIGSVANGFTRFQEEDILFAKITPCMENGKGYLTRELVNGIGFGSTEFHVLRPMKQVCPGYVYYWSVSLEFRTKAKNFMIGSAGQQRVPKTFFEKFHVTSINFEEQRRIAEVLDTVDEAIRKTEQIIEKLKKVKDGLLHDLLTRGVDENGNLRDPERNPELFKDSPLGQIPKDWEVCKMSDIGDIIRGASPRPKGHPKYYNGPIPRLMGEDVTRDGKWVYPLVDSLTIEGAKLSRPMKKGSLVIICSGDVGIASFLAVDACIHDGFLAFRSIIDNVLPDFLYWWFKRNKQEMDLMATHGGVFTNLTTSILKDTQIAIPLSKTEQETISFKLDDADTVILNEIDTLNKLRSLKQGLMEDLLSGKVSTKDMRAVA